MNNSTTTIPTIVATPDYLLLLIDWPFFIVHLSIALFVVVKVVKRNADFRGGRYYILFLFLAGGDALYFLEVTAFRRYHEIWRATYPTTIKKNLESHFLSSGKQWVYD